VWPVTRVVDCGTGSPRDWGALLTPGTLAIIEASFRPAERGRAIGAWSGFGGIFGALGPFLGGLLVQWVSWRLVFFINAPITAVTIWVVVRHVPESRQSETVGPLDVQGPLLAALGFGGVTYALMKVQESWGSTAILGSLTIGLLLLASFIVNEARHPSPVLPLICFGLASLWVRTAPPSPSTPPWARSPSF